VRENVALMDMSFMSKFLVQGRDAGKVLNTISANQVNGPANRITYTQWLNERGTLEADLTVTKLAEDRFLVVVADTMHRHAFTWLQRHIPADAHCFATDMTSAYAQVNLIGPRARELMSALTSADMSNAAFPYRHGREIEIGYARVLCIRISYVGELGYELYIPTEQALHVYDLIVEAGEAFDLRHAGLKALNSLRMEKAYRDYGHDMDNTDNPYEVGLGQFVRLDKAEDFIGKQSCIRMKRAYDGTKRLVQVLVKDPEPFLFHAEVVLRDGLPLGYVTSGAYAFTLGGAAGLAMIHADRPIDEAYISNGKWEVNIAGRRYPAEISLKPMYDPEGRRLRS